MVNNHFFRSIPVAVILTIVCTRADAQDDADPGVPPIAVQQAPAGFVPCQVVDAYQSTTLQASFLAEWMYIDMPSGRVTFWGARITGMDNGSPLTALGVRCGDVITRLDGIRISQNMRRRPNSNVYDLPELERHYGLTEFRYIHTGTNQVRIRSIDLGTGGPSPVQP